jgi:hypothetical protein
MSWSVAAINPQRKVIIIKTYSSLFTALSCSMLYYYMSSNTLLHTSHVNLYSVATSLYLSFNVIWVDNVVYGVRKQ